MIVEYIRYAIEAGRADAFRQAYAEAAGILQADPRCLSYEIARGLEEPTHFVVRIEWDSLDGHLEGFRKDPAFGGFFALVRPFFDDIEEMQHYEVQTTSPGLPEKGLPSLYDWAGGHEAIAALINAFYDRVEHDELLGPFFPGGVTAEHREHVTAWWSEVLGGPAQYTPPGGYPRMLAHHLGLTSPSSSGGSSSLCSASPPTTPTSRTTQSFVPHSSATPSGRPAWPCTTQTGADVVREAPVPRWGWGSPRRMWGDV